MKLSEYFDNEIEEEEIEVWLNQFNEDEIPIIVKLIR